jgi:hypothetical protein
MMAENGGFESTPFAQPCRISLIIDQSRCWSGFRASWHMSDDTHSYRLVTAKYSGKCSQSVARPVANGRMRNHHLAGVVSWFVTAVGAQLASANFTFDHILLGKGPKRRSELAVLHHQRENLRRGACVRSALCSGHTWLPCAHAPRVGSLGLQETA